MAQNEVVSVLTSEIADGLHKPQVDEEIFRLDSDYGLASTWGALGRAGKVMDVGGMSKQFFHEYPYRREVEVTANATAGSAVTITCDSTSFITKNAQLYDPVARQTLYASADPGSSTTFVARTLNSNISSGTKLIILNIGAEESWQRPTPKGRATENHTDYLTTIKRSTAISWHEDGYQNYGGKKSWARLDERNSDELNRDVSYTLLFSNPGAGVVSTDVPYSTRGLMSWGTTYNWIPVGSGAMTPRLLSQGAYALKKFGKANKLQIITSQALADQAATYMYRSGGDGFARTAVSTNFGGAPPKFGTSVMGLNNIPVMTDSCFDHEGLDDVMLLVNWDCLQAMKFKNMEIRKPSAARPEGIADPGAGDIQSLIVYAFGLGSKFPRGAVVAFTGVSRFSV